MLCKRRDGLEIVPAWSHKPNDAGSSPAPATKILKWRKRGFHGNPIVDARFSNSKECVGASPTLSTNSALSSLG